MNVKFLRKKVFFIFIISMFLGLFSCKDKNKTDNETSSSTENIQKEEENQPKIDTKKMEASFSDDIFKLDYTPLKPEEKAVAGKLNASTPVAQKGTSQSKERKVRELNEYKTKYNTERKKYSDFDSNEESDKVASSTSSKELEILDWGPKHIVSENENPTFYVVFSEPVRSLKALSDVTDVSDVMSISPKINGVFRWLGTDQIAFEASEPAIPSECYKITISENVKAVSGAKLSSKKEFETKAEEVIVRNIRPGSTIEKYYDYSRYSGIPLKDAKNFVATLNLKITKEKLESIAWVSDESKGELKYQAEPIFEQKYGAVFDKEKKITNTFAIKIIEADKLKKNETYYFRVRGDDGYSSEEFCTIKPFRITYISGQVGHSNSEMTNPIRIEFNQIPKKENLASFFAMTGISNKITDSNVKISGTTVYIYNLDMSNFGSYYELSVSPKLTDVYGQKLSNSANELRKSIRLPDAKSYFNLADSGTKILEWQFPHKIAFDYQNILDGSGYNISKVDDPIQSSYLSERDFSVSNSFEKVADNVRHISTVDLNPYLDEGFGFVEFITKAKTYYFYKDWNSDVLKKNYSTDATRLTVQVTDLGVTTRIGINRVVALVRSLSTNKPVENASVTVYINDSYRNDGYISTKSIATGTTDKDGFVVIPLNDEQRQKLRGNIALFVQSGKDKVTFIPDSHRYSWHSPKGALEKRSRIFMFTDRGVYKPGETVSFRGIDKIQCLGNFTSYKGDYKIELRKSSWDDNTVYSTLYGKTSSSGGFYGSFDLPKDLEPGNYEIYYKENDGDSRTLYFQVAYFEPVKTQTTITIPNTTYYAGDSVNATIESSYLAGGALSDADYDTTWLRNPIDFSPDTPITNGFRFGPIDRYEASKEIQQNHGQLSADGRANDSIKTEKTDLEVPYNYVLDASVTDVSNQRISAMSSVVVHSSRFYAGLRLSSNGFPKKGEKVDVPFILVTPDGEKATSDLFADDLNIDVTRISWELSNVNGVNDEIYSRYEEVKTSVKSEKIKPVAEGKISFTPEKSGRYVLTLKTRDKFGNPVKTEYGFYVTGSDYYWYGAESNELNLTPNKNLYNPGDTAQVLLSSPLEKGDYLITVEREGIFTQEVRHFDSSCSVIDVPIARNFVPVVYVSVSSYSTRTKQPTHEYGEKDTDKPKGYYGVAELNVNPYVRAFSVSIESDKMVYRPGENATITLKATRGGKPVENAELTLMVVDRAILDLINYHVPNPISFFYDKYYFQNYVIGGDSRDLLMDPVTYAIKNLQGGDADEEKEKERKEFKPTALFEPVLTTDKNGVASVTFKLPDNLTTFRLTAFGVQEDLFALQESEIGVRNPINVQSVQPRRLRVRDTAECGVLVTNLDSVSHKIDVSLSIRTPQNDYEADSEKGLATVKGKAFIDGESSQTIEVPSGASYTAYFDVVAEQKGNVELVYSVKSDVLKEKLVSPILIEKSYVYETVTMTGSTDEEKTATDKQFIQIPSWVEDGEGELSVTLDATQLGMLASAVEYVFKYPYGCIEQRTTATLPFVIFEKYIKVFGINSEVKDVKQLIKSHFKFLKKYQRSDGGFGYWPESTWSSLYVSVRVAELYAYALEHGYTSSDLQIDLDALTTYIESQLKDIRYYGSNTYKARAYYALGMCEKYHDSEVEALYALSKEKDLTTLGYCGLYFASQKSDSSKAKVKEITEEIRKYLQISQRSVSVIEPTNNNYWSFFNSDIEQMSIFLKLFVQNDQKDIMVDKLVYTLLNKQKAGFWKSTTDTASVLEAVCTYIKERNLDAVDFTAQAKLMGIELVNGKFKGAGAKTASQSYEFKSPQLSKLERGKNLEMTFSKNGTGRLYYTTELKYALPDELQNSRDEGLRISYQIIEASSGKQVEPIKDSKIIELKSGVTYKAKIILSTSKDRNYLALRSPIPSGAEILDANFVTSGHDSEIETDSYEDYWWGHWMSNQALYDNEARFFWDNFDKGSCTVEFKFRTARRGVYPVPPVQAELMYEPEVFGRSDGYLFVIK